MNRLPSAVMRDLTGWLREQQKQEMVVGVMTANGGILGGKVQEVGKDFLLLLSDAFGDLRVFAIPYGNVCSLTTYTEAEAAALVREANEQMAVSPLVN